MSGRLADRLSDLRTPDVPEFVQLCAQSGFALWSDQGRAGRAGRAVAAHGQFRLEKGKHSKGTGFRFYTQLSRSTLSGLAFRARRVPNIPARPTSSAPINGSASSQGCGCQRKSKTK